MKTAKMLNAVVVATGQPMKDADRPGFKVNPQLELLTAGGVDDGAYYPAQSINVYGEAGIKALRDFCDELLAAPEIKTP